MSAKGQRAILTGERTYLRHPAAEDEEEFLALRRASAELHRPWEPEAGPEPYSPERYESYLEGHGPAARRERLLLCRREDDAILGAIHFNEIVLGCFQSAYAGYWIGAPFVRRGYMTEGFRLALRHAFENLGLHRVEANVVPENEVSLKIVRKLGFRREGYSPRYLKIAGEWRDHERWAMLAEEWTGAPEGSR